MIACFDVHYENDTAYTAALVFNKWEDAEPIKRYTSILEHVEEYIPGQFYKRELPPLLKCFKEIEENIEIIVIDGFVWLGENKMGMGAYLYNALDKRIPVIGVAKNFFRQATNTERIYRGESKKALFVSSIGIEQDKASGFIGKMDGEYRFPTLLKEVDSLCRNFWKT